MSLLVVLLILAILILGALTFVVGRGEGSFPRGRWVVFGAAFALGAVLDLVTKHWAFTELPSPGSTVALTSWFSFTHARNEGAAFGMFQGQHDFFMVVTVIALVAVPYFVHTVRERALVAALVLGLILSGVVGNFWDRMVYGYVRDFLDVHTPPTGALHDFVVRVTGRDTWPTFNVADVFITCGAAAVVLFMGHLSEEPEPAEDEADAGQSALADEDPPAASDEAASHADGSDPVSAGSESVLVAGSPDAPPTTPENAPA